MNKTLRLNNLKTRRAMNAKILVFLICVEAIMYFLLYNLHDSRQLHAQNIKTLEQGVKYIQS